MRTRPAWRLQDRIARARTEAGLTQAQLSDALGVSRQAVNRWEAGHVCPRKRDLIAIAHVCGVDLDWLTEDDGQPAGIGVATVRSAARRTRRGSTSYRLGRGQGRARSARPYAA